jgi:phosphomevalonate kinase
MNMKRITVPGNLLLMGEYAVLEPGGLGLAVAPEKRIEVKVEPAAELSIRGAFGDESVLWTRNSPGASPLFNAVVEECENWLRSVKWSSDSWNAAITIDSSAFFKRKKGKSGYGSSASVTVGLMTALLGLAGVDDKSQQAVASGLAVQAHRRAQSGQGSGYDVLTSLNGGLGLFTGGELPHWQPLRLPWLPFLSVFHGKKSVSTPNSVERYRSWQKKNPYRAREFFEQSNRLIRDFVNAQGWSEGQSLFLRYRELSLELGEAIGVQAEIEPPQPIRGAWCKAVGAGNEVGICLSRQPIRGRRYEKLKVAERGIQWDS